MNTVERRLSERRLSERPVIRTAVIVDAPSANTLVYNCFPIPLVVVPVVCCTFEWQVF
jgi:hypothetical protein